MNLYSYSPWGRGTITTNAPFRWRRMHFGSQWVKSPARATSLAVSPASIENRVVPFLRPLETMPDPFCPKLPDAVVFQYSCSQQC